MLIVIRKMGFALLSPFIEDRISVRRVRLLQWGDIEWHCLHYLKGGTGGGVKRHNRPTRGAVQVVQRHRFRLYGTGSVQRGARGHGIGSRVPAPPYSSVQCTSGNGAGDIQASVVKDLFFCQIFANIVRPSWYNLCPMSNEFAELTTWLVIWLWVNPWLDFLLCTLMYQGIISI